MNQNFILFVLFFLLNFFSVYAFQGEGNVLRNDEELNWEEQYAFYDEITDDSLLSYELQITEIQRESQISNDEQKKLLANYLLLRLLVEKSEMNKAHQVAEDIQHNNTARKEANAVIYLNSQFYLSRIYEALGESEKALAINYDLIDQIDERFLKVNSLDKDLLQYKNFMVLAANYLFQIDSLSCLYANKALENARNLRDEKRVYQAMDFTYYCNYFSDNGPLLNAIADSCINYARRVGNYESLGTAYMHKCNALVVLGFEDDAEVFCEKAISEFRKSNDPVYLTSAYHNIANVFEKTEDNKRSLKYYERSYEIAKGIENTEEYLTSLYGLASKYLDVGEYRRSSELFKVYADSQLIYQQNLLSSQFAEAESKYQAREREVEIAEQKLQLANQKAIRNRILLGGSILFLGGLLLFQWFRNNQRRKAQVADFELKQKRKETEQLKALDQMKSQLFTNVSHELRTPLTLIIGPLENIIEKNEDPKMDKDLRLAFSNSKRLNGLVSEILDLAKIESGKIRLKQISTNLNTLLNRLFYAFESLADSKHIKLVLHNRVAKKVNFLLDVDMFEKVINNLLANAIKFTESGGTVSMDAALSEEKLLLSVKDNGPGIEEGDESKIFERFYQSKQRETNFTGGTGVGLALSKEIVDLLGGELSAENNLDKGATFSLTLPLEKTDEKVLIPTLNDEERSEEWYTPILLNGERPKILIVEDNNDMSGYLKSILEKDFECEIVKDGFECLKKLQTEHFDVVSSDVMMPRMDGFTLKRKINSLERFRNVPFIFLTARVLEEDKLEGLSLGVNDYITKPFSRKEYLTRVRNVLVNKQASEEIQEDSIDDSSDRKLLKKAERWILDHISDPEIKVSDLAHALNYSQRQLSRVIKKLTGLTPVNLILEIKLLKAYQWIQERKYETTSEIRYELGISSASYFSKKFKERFGVLPSEL